jgi:hypothetical protein
VCSRGLTAARRERVTDEWADRLAAAAVRQQATGCVCVCGRTDRLGCLQQLCAQEEHVTACMVCSSSCLQTW